MAVTYGFYNSIGGDRKYDAVQMSAVFDGIIKDGVFDSIGEIFKVTPGTGLQVVVGSGRAWFDHTWTLNDAKLPLTIEAPDVTLKRYDAVVLEVNSAQATRANSIKVVTGTPGTEPSKPAMANTEEVHQHALAYVLVEPGIQSIAESKIENVVGKSETPFVTAILETVSIDSLFTQWNGQFNDWFENVQSQLEGDVVTNLQRQIDLKVPKTTITTLKANQLILPNGSETFGQIAMPSAASFLIQRPNAAPVMLPYASALQEAGCRTFMHRKLNDIVSPVSKFNVNLRSFPWNQFSRAIVEFDIKTETYNTSGGTKNLGYRIDNVQTTDVYRYYDMSAWSSKGTSIVISAFRSGWSASDPDMPYPVHLEVTIERDVDSRGATYLGEIRCAKDNSLISYYTNDREQFPASGGILNFFVWDDANKTTFTVRNIKVWGVQ